MALADAGFGAQSALQEMIKRRVLEQQAAADAQAQAASSARADRGLDLQEAQYFSGLDRDQRRETADADKLKFDQGNTLAEQMPGGTMLEQDAPEAAKLPGYLLTKREPMGEAFAGPSPLGETPEQAQRGGFLKTRTSKQQEQADAADATRAMREQTQSNADRSFGLQQQARTDAQANADRSFGLQQAGLDARTKQDAPDAQPSPYGQERSRRVLESVDNLMGQINNFTAGPGSLLSVIPGTPQRDFAAQLKTLQSNIAFSELQEMREASKTGGALGQVSERELDLLSSVLGSLDAGQSPAALKSQLQQVRDSLARWNAAKSGVAAPDRTGGGAPPEEGGGGRVYYDLDGNPVTR